MGHHYESLTTASKKMRGLEGKKVSFLAQRRRGAEKRRDDSDEWMVGGTEEERLYELAYEDFKRNLERLRAIVPVSTVCMHGSPLSGIDNLDLLRKYDYKSLGVVAEPYLDIDFDEVFYLTDTGRRWDGWKVSVRDKMPQQEEWVRQGLVFHSTCDIIRAVEVPDVRGRRSEVGLPDKVMMTVHPQRWDDRPWPWVKELVGQNIKNVIKSFILQKRTKEAKGE